MQFRKKKIQQKNTKSTRRRVRYLPHYKHAYLRLHSTFTCRLAWNNEIFICLIQMKLVSFHKLSDIDKNWVNKRQAKPNQKTNDNHGERRKKRANRETKRPLRCDVLIELWIKIKCNRYRILNRVYAYTVYLSVLRLLFSVNASCDSDLAASLFLMCPVTNEFCSWLS